jgi:hypothetical protein
VKVSTHPLYVTWQQMIQRCYKKTNTNYPTYGARGIDVCERWRESFLNFIADMGERPEGRTLDRRDSTRGYSKENCRWATVLEQNQNKSMMKRNTSGFRGVTYVARRKKWQVQCLMKYIGYFECRYRAAIAYNREIIRRKLSHVPLNNLRKPGTLIRWEIK